MLRQRVGANAMLGTILIGFLRKIGSGTSHIQRVLDWLSRAVVFYVIPIAIALISLAALFLWEDLYSARPEKQLDLHVLAQPDHEFSISDAQQKLPEVPATRYYNTNLSERPVWFSFSWQETPDSAKIVEFPSRHAVRIECWNGASLRPLGDSSSTNPAGDIFKVKAGFALRLEHAEKEVICRSSFVGPARLSADLWRATQLDVASQSFHRQSGLIDGGLIVLALFVLISALFNRQSLYLIFAAWLIVTVRLSATSGGWDDQWLNHAVPEDWLSQGRSFTRAAWALLTVTLFKRLFHDDLVRLRYAVPISILQWLCMALFVAAAFLPRSIFLPTMWALGLVWVPFFIYCLVRIVVKTRTTVALLYGASLAVTLISTLFEILAASYGTKGIDNSINSVIASLSSGLLISLAIAEQMRQEHKQRLQAQHELQHTYDAIPIGLFTLDLQGCYTSSNPALLKMLGPRAFKSHRNTWQQYFGADAWLQLYQMVHRQDDGELEIRSQMDVTGKEGPRRFLIKAALANGKIEGSLQDVTEKSIATEELDFLANNDSLTKVLNRRGLEQVFKSAVARIDDDHPLAMAYLDLDRFKLINDLYGHNAGDDILKQVCERIIGMLSGRMRIGRVGGDEFVIVLPDTRMPLATVICRGIVDSIDLTPFRVGEKAFHVRGSIGLIEIGPGTLMKEALSTSDRACREAKAGQNKGLVVYERDAPAFKEHKAELRLIQHLSSSESIEGMFVEMQPIMSLTRPNDSLNFEVLLRMRDPEGHLIPVSRVIAAGEHSGRMSVIDRWVLSTTLAWLDQNRARLKYTQFVCMNLNGASLNDEEFLHEVFELLRRNSHVVSFLSIEITESVALHDLQNTRRFIDKVRGLGARVALDDFGAGYTSFSYLKDLPADLLKIDGSFIVNMNQHPANVSIVEAIVNLARNLGMKTIAEWAEDAATVQTLAEIGVDYVQGFVVARPMTPEKLMEAKSAASFIKDETLLRFINQMGQADDPMTRNDLILQDLQEIPRKIH